MPLFIYIYLEIHLRIHIWILLWNFKSSSSDRLPAHRACLPHCSCCCSAKFSEENGPDAHCNQSTTDQNYDANFCFGAATAEASACPLDPLSSFIKELGELSSMSDPYISAVFGDLLVQQHWQLHCFMDRMSNILSQLKTRSRQGQGTCQCLPLLRKIVSRPSPKASIGLPEIFCRLKRICALYLKDLT